MKFFFVCFLCALMIISCKKKEDDSCNNCQDGGPVEQLEFSYTLNGGSKIVADSAFFNASSKTITSYYQGIANRINIKTTSQIAGTYNFTTTANVLSYTHAGLTYMASGGYINITDNSNNKMSGNFITNGTGGGYTSVNGQFKDIAKK